MLNPPNKAKKEDSLFREKLAWNMRIRGWNQEKIADNLSISQPAVSKLLAKATSKYSKAFLEDIKQVKDEQIAQLENVASEAMAAWDRSKEDANGIRDLHELAVVQLHRGSILAHLRLYWPSIEIRVL
jgi:predicted transcriptional regulator